MILNTKDRGTLKQIMRDPRLNMGQEEELSLYSKPPCNDMDPWVTEEIRNLVFEWDQIRDSSIGKS